MRISAGGTGISEKGPRKKCPFAYLNDSIKTRTDVQNNMETIHDYLRFFVVFRNLLDSAIQANPTVPVRVCVPITGLTSPRIVSALSIWLS